MLIAFRQKHDLDLRSLAKELGISAATLMRIEHGHAFDLKTFIKLQNWFLKAKQ